MKETKKVRSKWLTIRLNDDEEKKLNQLFERSTSAGLSEYARDVLLKQPVNIIYRNQTADNFLAEMVLLKNELNAIGSNFNQVVHKLHILDTIPEFREWIFQYLTLHKSLVEKVEIIKVRMNQIYEQWLQK